MKYDSFQILRPVILPKNHKYHKNYKIMEIYSEDSSFLSEARELPFFAIKDSGETEQKLILNQVNHDEIFIYRCM